MADLWEWNRPDEPGLTEPLISPVDLIGGVGSGLVAKGVMGKLASLATKGGGKVLQHGGAVGGKLPSLTSTDKIASLRRAVEGINKKDTYSQLANGLNDLMKQAGWTYQIKP